MRALLEVEHVEEVLEALPRRPAEALDDLIQLDVVAARPWYGRAPGTRSLAHGRQATTARVRPPR
jgi:hypothetical protein